jgi:hypothetical protein
MGDKVISGNGNGSEVYFRDFVIEKHTRTETLCLVTNVINYSRVVVEGSFESNGRFYINELFSNDGYRNNVFKVTGTDGNRYSFESVSFREGTCFDDIVFRERLLGPDDGDGYMPSVVPLKNGDVYIPTKRVKWKKL